MVGAMKGREDGDGGKFEDDIQVEEEKAHEASRHDKQLVMVGAIQGREDGDGGKFEDDVQVEEKNDWMANYSVFFFYSGPQRDDDDDDDGETQSGEPKSTSPSCFPLPPTENLKSCTS